MSTRNIVRTLEYGDVAAAGARSHRRLPIWPILLPSFLVAAGCTPPEEAEPIVRIIEFDGVVDLDGDGTPADRDCDDDNPNIFPGAPELAYDGIDQDCDGFDLLDVDGDGFIGGEAGGPDCDDENPSVHPGALDVPGDGIDQDCSGSDYVDADHDGYSPTGSSPDCDDNDPTAFPGATEVQDGVDNDCDGEVDELPYPKEIELVQAPATLTGGASSARLSSALALTGDYDRDGIDDLAVGVPGLDQVLFIPGNGALGLGAAPSVAVTFQGPSGEGVGAVLGRGGDLNGDGWIDAAFGAPYAASGAGRVYLVSGTEWTPGTVVPLSEQALFLEGDAPGDALGSAVSSGLDVNGDGLGDLLIGAPGAAPEAESAAGSVYLYQTPQGVPASSGPASAASTIVIYGDAAGNALGGAVLLSDLDGDGLGDLLMGAPGSSSSKSAAGGDVVVLYGRQYLADIIGPRLPSAAADLVIFDDSVDAATAAAGTAMASCDVNGDGLLDLLVSAPRAAHGSAADQGRVYYFAGNGVRWGGDLELSMATGSYWGESAGALAGSSLTCAGDINDDGYEEVLVGVPGRNGGQGGAYIVYGSPAGWPKEGIFGQGAPVLVGGGEGDRAGASVVGGDLNGDGLGDMVVGAPERSEGALEHAGQLYLLPGSAD